MHTISVLDLANGFARADRIIMGLITVSYGAGGGAGAAVTAAVTLGDLPATYSVFTGASADATAYVSAQTSTGFTLNVSPRLAANTLAAGSMKVLILA
jgi:hypothetical protein